LFSGGDKLDQFSATIANHEELETPSVMIHQKEKKKIKKPKIPKVYICSRTHTQIAQIIKELRRTAYRNLNMCVLGSRKQLCVNRRALRRREDINEVCRDFCKLNKCKYRHRSEKIVQSERIDKVAHDIEDLVEEGRSLKACPYFGTKERAEKIADVIFCPYNYIIDPRIRSAMNIDLKGGVVVVDEAHNIEDVCRDATSASWSKFAMAQVKIELEKCREKGILLNIISPILSIVDNLVPWFNGIARQIEKDDSFVTNHRNVFGYEKSVDILDKWGINNTQLALLAGGVREIREWLKQEEENAVDAQSLTVDVSDGVLRFIEEFTTMATYLLDNKHKEDFKMAVIPSSEYDSKSRRRKTVHILEVWCFNPAIAFQQVVNDCRSVILTSGTLTPQDSFSSELGCVFKQKFIADHVIPPTSLFVGALSYGAGRYQLSSTWKVSKSPAYQDALGKTILSLIKEIPDGVLVFLPSYKLMNDLKATWQDSGVWEEMNKWKECFLENRGAGKNSKEEFERLIGCYRHQCSLEDGRGAMFFAVCRGKISEGIDFSDEQCRAALLIGIPYPHWKDQRIIFKRQYNDLMSSRPGGYITGRAWYSLQAFRALNQALGRCIRHAKDYGAILFLDHRFTGQNGRMNGEKISKWARKRLTEYDNLPHLEHDLNLFFNRLRENPPGGVAPTKTFIEKPKEPVFTEPDLKPQPPQRQQKMFGYMTSANQSNEWQFGEQNTDSTKKRPRSLSPDSISKPKFGRKRHRANPPMWPETPSGNQDEVAPFAIPRNVATGSVSSLNYEEAKGSFRPSDICCWTDGSSIKNPGPCGAGAVVTFNSKRYQVYQALGQGTNNIGELNAVSLSFQIVRKLLKSAMETNVVPVVRIITDSKYVQGIICNKKWVAKKNIELIRRIKEELGSLQVQINFHWVKAHANTELNEIADRLAKAGASKSNEWGYSGFSKPVWTWPNAIPKSQAQPPDIWSPPPFDRSLGTYSVSSTSTEIDPPTQENATQRASISYSSYSDSKVEDNNMEIDPLNESDEKTITPAIKKNVDIDISGFSTDEDGHFRVRKRPSTAEKDKKKKRNKKKKKKKRSSRSSSPTLTEKFYCVECHSQLALNLSSCSIEKYTLDLLENDIEKKWYRVTEESYSPPVDKGEIVGLFFQHDALYLNGIFFSEVSCSKGCGVLGYHVRGLFKPPSNPAIQAGCLFIEMKKVAGSVDHLPTVDISKKVFIKEPFPEYVVI